MPSLGDDLLAEAYSDVMTLRRLQVAAADLHAIVERSCSALAESQALLQFADTLDGPLIQQT